MSFELPQGQRDKDLPDEIYVSLVKSLFRDPRNLIIGSLGTIGAALITAFKTGDPVFFSCTVALTVVALARAWDMRAFGRDRHSDLDLIATQRWELRYVFGSSAYVLVMGMWCFFAFARTSDPMTQLLCFSMVLVNIIGIAARNFGSKLLVTTQLICAGVPLFFGLAWTANIYYLLAACVLAPFFRSFSTIADHLRLTLTGAVVAARDVRLLADRLDAALNNMSHGLCMVDSKGVLAISNQRLPHLLGVRSDAFQAGRPAFEAFVACLRAGLIDPAQSRHTLAAIHERLVGRCREPMLLSIKGQRTLLINSRNMADGGSVMLIEDVTEQKEAEAHISRLAHYDSLTGLPNRVMLRESVTLLLPAVDNDGGCAVLFIDLDEFKQVNDTLGHPCGDQLLKLVAGRLRDITDAADLIARLGGDEFVVVLSRVGHVGGAAGVAQQLVEELRRPYEVDGHLVIIGASIGIALAPRDGLDADTLLKNADMALYRAKADGRGRYRFFETEMEVRVQERRALELDLRETVRNEALELYYQPLVDLKTGRIAACEALLRWPHPERGLISPGEFISMSEEMGLIVEIGRWVLITACREAASWPSAIRVSVNLSPFQFRQLGLLEAIGEALSVSGLSPDRLDVEITESTLLRDTESVLETLRRIRQLGVTISLDDFGTGYSSLSYILKFPLHTVKIDRSFLLGIEANEKQQALLRGIARLCGELGVRVVIEGVETYEQLDIIVRNPEIGEAQGFLFAKPAPAAHTRRLLQVPFLAQTSVSNAKATLITRTQRGA